MSSCHHDSTCKFTNKNKKGNASVLTVMKEKTMYVVVYGVVIVTQAEVPEQDTMMQEISRGFCRTDLKSMVQLSSSSNGFACGISIVEKS
eukprot:scaffold9231_cov130-Skeletonema_menzelii.AAC.1